jgi:PAS domain S-box-containing protein
MESREYWVRCLGTTREALFVSDQEGRIVWWNEGARKLLGFTEEDVLGKPCCSLLGGRRAGRSWCEADCRVRRSMRRGALPSHVTLELRAKDGRILPVNVSFIVRQDRRKPVLVHLLQDVSRQERMREAVRGIRGILHDRDMRRPWIETEGPPAPDRRPGHPDAPNLALLTRREIEILRLLSKGLSTEAIAAELGVSRLTARNHIQNAIHKMGLHNRTQAVALALEQGLH